MYKTIKKEIFFFIDNNLKIFLTITYLEGSILSIAASDNSGADLGVFMCKDSALVGTIGIAWVGSLCKTSKTYWKGANAGINEKHNMGMLHDFDVKQEAFTN